MPAEVKKEIELEIAYVLFIDIVGYSKLLIDQQRRIRLAPRFALPFLAAGWSDPYARSELYPAPRLR